MEEEEEVPAHQPDELEFGSDEEAMMHDAVDDVDDVVPTEAEKDAARRLRDLSRSPPRAQKAAKRPRSPGPPEDVVPDLAEIFDNYDTPHPVRVSICRAYASYIASLQPKKPKAASRKKN